MTDNPTVPVQFRDCPGYTGYRVGDDGSVWTRWKLQQRANKILGNQWRHLKIRQVIMRRRRPGVMTCVISITRDGEHHGEGRGGRRKLASVHRLVLEAFVGPCPEGLQARHLNDVPTDNRLVNLCWGTPHDNMMDRRRNGIATAGERHVFAKLTDAQAEEIRTRYAQGGVTQAALADEFRISRPKISRIVRHLVYVPQPPPCQA